MTFSQDIALVKLAEPVKLGTQVNVACLPDEKDYFPAGTVCITAGWGHTTEGKEMYGYNMHVPIIHISTYSRYKTLYSAYIALRTLGQFSVTW